MPMAIIIPRRRKVNKLHFSIALSGARCYNPYDDFFLPIREQEYLK